MPSQLQSPSQSNVLCLVNGQQTKSVPATDRGLAYGDGLFETLRFKSMQLPLQSFHLARLARGANALDLPLEMPWVEQTLQLALHHAQHEGIEDGVVKLMVTRGSGGRGYVPPASASCNYIVLVRAHQPLTLRADSVALKTCTATLGHNKTLAGLKHLNRLEHILAAQSVELAEAEQGLVFDHDENLIETLHHNLFIVKQGVLLTPDLSLCGVAGVMRQAILDDIAASVGVPIQVAQLRQQDLAMADEVFICNGVHGVVPVSRWLEQRWPRGEVTRRIMHSISERWTGFYDR